MPLFYFCLRNDINKRSHPYKKNNRRTKKKKRNARSFGLEMRIFKIDKCRTLLENSQTLGRFITRLYI